MSNALIFFLLIGYGVSFIFGSVFGLFTCWEFKITNFKEFKEWMNDDG